ncbi:MAG: class I tRNA ligase family protein [Candidatus Moraniibacteriota bacterium]
MFKKVDSKMNLPKMEEEILDFWEREKIFEKSVTNREGSPRYTFYDGPPFATGTPHYGHIVGNILKDAVPRYWTMRGFQVERKWGWDCHGLPIENIAEKELGIKHKKDIEALGVAKFNEFCRSKVLEFAAEWERIIPRIGRWADMKHAYRTMDRDYMESVWWVFKELWDKGLIYESYRSMHICPRCETTLSQQEVSEGYVTVKDLSVVAKFELVDEPNTFVLAWTTTPWTLPGNVALAVGEDIEYAIINKKDLEYRSRLNPDPGERLSDSPIRPGKYIVARNILQCNLSADAGLTELWDIFDDASGLDDDISAHLSWEEIYKKYDVEFVKGADLVGKSYKPLFDYYEKDKNLENRENGWKIYAADFVNTEEGTGVVHIAPAFGEDDMNLGKKKNLPFVQHVNMDGTMKEEVRDFAGRDLSEKAKGKVEEVREIDIDVKRYLEKNDLFFASRKYEHSYPHCWRCDTPLLNYATSSWFVRVTNVKDRALELAKNIQWSPEHIKEGRFGKWLEGARDWSISRQRYWASVMPIWKCECGEMSVFGSAKELEDASGKKIEDLHKHTVDAITVSCRKCKKEMHRIPDVLDTWFDSGSMPYAEMHYPFENREKFETGFPAQFIAEGVDQTRAWFYYLHVLGVSLRDSNAFQHVIVNGTVLAEDGKKMSKKLKNYPDPMGIVEKHGADALRFYLLSSPVVAAENFNFSERDLVDSTRNSFRMLWNTYSFFVMYANIDEWKPKETLVTSENLLDRWIQSELQVLIKEVNSAMETYELNRAVRALVPFFDHLSNWYIRRSRKRFWKSEDDADKDDAYQTLYDILVTLSKLMAPFTPFIAEEMYRNLTEKESVHLEDFPVTDEGLLDENLLVKMDMIRDIINDALKERSIARVKVRQPLHFLEILYKDGEHPLRDLEKEFLDILKEEVNVKEVRLEQSSLQSLNDPLRRGWMLSLDTEITPELRLEGEAREIIRAIQEGRKKAGFNVEDRIVFGYSGKETVFAFSGDASQSVPNLKETIEKEVLATEVKNEALPDAEYSEEVNIEGEKFTFWLRRV